MLVRGFCSICGYFLPIIIQCYRIKLSNLLVHIWETNLLFLLPHLDPGCSSCVVGSRLACSRRTGCGGSAPGSSSASWCHTRRASSGRRRRGGRGPPRSPAPSGWSHMAPGAGCSSPAPHLHTDTSASLRRSRHCGEENTRSSLVLTVQNSEDFLHHLPQDEDVGLRIRGSSRFPVLAVLARLAEVTFLVFGMSGCCGDILQTRNPWNHNPNTRHRLSHRLAKFTIYCNITRIWSGNNPGSHTGSRNT